MFFEPARDIARKLETLSKKHPALIGATAP